METDRRGFFRILASAAAFLSGRATARTADREPEIHRASRNNQFGAVGPKHPRGAPGPPFKTYPNAPRTALPAAQLSGRAFAEVIRSDRIASGFAPVPLPVGDLATLLHCANGVTGTAPQRLNPALRRAAPSAGALYAGEVYVVAERVHGLPSGLYYYDVEKHRLVRVREGALLADVAQALERPGQFENAAAVVLLTNVFGRYTRRYANRGYRYALIDSGHIGENLRLAVSASGLTEASPLRFWDDRLNDLLGVDGSREAVCAIHAIGQRDSRDRPAPKRERRLIEEQSRRPAAAGMRTIERFHRATRLVPETAGPSTDAAPSGAKPAAPAGRGRGLPHAAPSDISVAQAIRERRSAQAFSSPPIALGELGFVLEAADGNASMSSTGAVQVFAIAHRVAGLEPGVYRHAPTHRELVPVLQANLNSRLVGACLGQKMAGSAAVGFAMAASLGNSASELGDRRYRDLLLESGAIAQRIYLAAEALGLVARNLAAFMDDRFNRLLDFDSRGLSALHLTMLGHGR